MPIKRDKEGKFSRSGKVWFHGTSKDFQEYKGKQTPGMQYGFGTHFTTDPDFASEYADKKGGNIRAGTLDRSAKVLKSDEAFPLDHPLIKDLYRRKKHILEMHRVNKVDRITPDFDQVQPKTAEKILRKHGYDAVEYEAKVGRRFITPGGRVGMTVDRRAPALAVINPAVITNKWSRKSGQDNLAQGFGKKGGHAGHGL